MCRAIVSSFIYRRGGDAPIYDEEAPSEAIERIVQEGAAEGSKYRASNKFQIQLVFEFWKAILHEKRKPTKVDEEYVRQFIADNISAQIPEDEREGYWKYYDELNPDDLKFRNICYLLKSRTKLDLRQQLTDALYKFAYSRGFSKQSIIDLDFYCQMMEVPSEKIRQADFAAKHWVDGQRNNQNEHGKDI